MRRILYLAEISMILASSLCLTVVRSVADEPSDTPHPALEVRLLSEDRLRIGTNDIEVSSLPKALARHTNSSSIALIGSGATNGPTLRERNLLSTLVTRGLPVFFVESEDALVRKPTTAQSGPTRIGFSDSQLKSLLHMHQGSTAAPRASSNRLSIGTGFDIDSDQHAYELRKVELGFYGDRLWLVHERLDDHEDSSGIQIKKTW